MESMQEEVRSSVFWRAALAEVIGTCFLVFIGCGSCIGSWDETYQPTIVQISLAFGLTVATMVWCFGHISGGHINPAVTMAMLFTRKISLLKAGTYVVAQCLGALLGGALLKGITPLENRGALGVTMLHPNVTQYQGFGVEFCMTFVLILTVFACCDDKREDFQAARPLNIGLAVTACHLFAIKFTGSSINPARSFGPALVMCIWNDHWIYWCGPLLGGLCAGLVYDNIFAANASVQKARDYLMTSNYEENVYDINPAGQKKQNLNTDYEENTF